MVMKYQEYTWEQLVADSAFREWVLRPDDESVRYWTDFLARHPTRTESVRQARRVVRQLAEATEALSPPVGQAEEEAVWQQLRQRIAGEPTWGRVVPLYPRWLYAWAVAGSVLLLVGLGRWWLSREGDGQTGTSLSAVTRLQTRNGLIDRINQTPYPETITLPDGSTVVLQPGSHLHYPAQFAPDQRIVVLSGDGFFSIVRNPARPFIVHAAQTVTRVLGTSFRVRALARHATVSVDVRTGQVTVYARTGAKQSNRQPDKSWAGVTLRPNQRAIFDVATQQLRRGLVDVPVALPTATTAAELTFEERPVAEVLAKLESMYGLTIRYDRAALADCVLTTTFTDESLFKRLTLICQAIGATYTTDDGQITIQSAGCTP